MTDTRNAWEQANERFTQLGRRLKEHYDQADAADAARAGEAGTDSDRQAVEQALRTLADAVNTAVTSVGDAVRDPEFRDEAKSAARALGDALAATFEEVGGELKDRFQGRRGSPPEA